MINRSLTAAILVSGFVFGGIVGAFAQANPDTTTAVVTDTDNGDDDGFDLGWLGLLGLAGLAGLKGRDRNHNTHTTTAHRP